MSSQKCLPQLSGFLNPGPICEGSEELMCCEFSQDGSLLAVGTTAGTVTVYQSSTGKPLYYLPNLQQAPLPVTAVRFCLMSAEVNADRILLVTYASGYIYNWHLSTQKCLSTIKEDRHTLAAKFAPDYLTFATAGSDNKLYIYDQSTKATQAILEPSMSAAVMDGHQNRVFGLAYHPSDVNLLISAGWDDTVQFWDKRHPHSVRRLSGPHVCGDALDIEPSSLCILTASWRLQDSIQVWDFGSLKLISTSQPVVQQSKWYAACWLSRDVALAGGSQKHLAILVNINNDKVLGSATGLDHGVYGVAHHKGKVAVAAGTNVFTATVNSSKVGIKEP